MTVLFGHKANTKDQADYLFGVSQKLHVERMIIFGTDFYIEQFFFNREYSKRWVCCRVICNFKQSAGSKELLVISISIYR